MYSIISDLNSNGMGFIILEGSSFISFDDSDYRILSKYYNKPVVAINKSRVIIHKNLYIYKALDEWYYIRSVKIDGDSDFYKCDQMEGLLKCLKDIYE